MLAAASGLPHAGHLGISAGDTPCDARLSALARLPESLRGLSPPGEYHRGMTFSRITTDPDVMGGQPTIRGLRMPVATVVAMVADGMTVGEIIAEHPDLTPEDVREALLYAAEAVRERELPLRHTA
jgi:uncharacterized protein (DUF433 family)